MFLSDEEIIDRCNVLILPKHMQQEGGSEFAVIEGRETPPMIHPFRPESISQVVTEINVSQGIHPVKQRVLSFGTSSYGYDVTLARDFKVFRTVDAEGKSIAHVPIDPLKLDDSDYQTILADDDGALVIPAGGFVLGRTMEYFHIPRDILVVCMGKSTYARLGINVLVTPLEPEWDGNVVVEIHNSNPRPVIIYANQGIGQFLFAKGGPIRKSYKDKGGKYMGQKGVQPAIV